MVRPSSAKTPGHSQISNGIPRRRVKCLLPDPISSLAISQDSINEFISCAKYSVKILSAQILLV
jgi:hypothetical protein